jgi:hypothetical protein
VLSLADRTTPALRGFNIVDGAVEEQEVRIT